MTEGTMNKYPSTVTGKTRYVGLPICGIELKSYYKDGKELVDYKGKTYEVGYETCDNHDADSCNSCGLGMESYSLNTSSDALSISKE